MTKKKKLPPGRPPPGKREIISAARDNIEFLREIRGMDMALASEIDQKLLSSPAFNCTFMKGRGISAVPVERRFRGVSFQGSCPRSNMTCASPP
jgi:hypothetical protein